MKKVLIFIVILSFALGCQNGNTEQKEGKSKMTKTNAITSESIATSCRRLLLVRGIRF